MLRQHPSEGEEVISARPKMPLKHSTNSQTDSLTAHMVLVEHLNGLSNSYRRKLGTVLRKWCAYLEGVGIRRTPDLLRTDPTAWDFVTSDLLCQYRQLLVHEAYINKTVNRHLTILRTLIHAV